MSESKHTPGPWEFEHPYGEGNCRNVDGLRVYRAFVESDNEGYICTVHQAKCHDAEANARLIAAAPELLEVCDQMRAALRGVQMGGELDRAQLQGILDAARDAIAKAKGKENES